MALGVTDLKKGTIFEFDGVPYRVMELTILLQLFFRS